MIYTLKLSNKEEMSITEDELEKFENNIGANFLKFENGIVNPSFVVCIMLDEEATYNENMRKLSLMKKDEIKENDFEILKKLHDGNSIQEIKRLSELLKKYDNKLLS